MSGVTGWRMRSTGPSSLPPSHHFVLRCLHLHLLLLLLLPLPSTAFRQQGAAVKGKLLCGGRALRNTRVKLYDLDRNPGDSDDLLDDKYTNKDGEFSVFGTTHELSDIEPTLYIYHDCNDDIKPCQKRVSLSLPKHSIVHGDSPRDSDWFDVGVLNLEATFPGQDRSCNH